MGGGAEYMVEQMPEIEWKAQIGWNKLENEEQGGTFAEVDVVWSSTSLYNQWVLASVKNLKYHKAATHQTLSQALSAPSSSKPLLYNNYNGHKSQ